MTEKEFYAVKSKLESSLETFIEACDEIGYDIIEEVADVLSEYNIEL